MEPDALTGNPNTEGSTAEEISAATETKKKRKRDDDSARLHEFLDVMKPPSKAKPWTAGDPSSAQSVDSQGICTTQSASGDAQSDEEYGTIHRKYKHTPKSDSTGEPEQAGSSVTPKAEGESVDPPAPALPTDRPEIAGAHAASDEDWLRSRTSRLLGLVDDDEALMPKGSVMEHHDHTTTSRLQRGSPGRDIADATTQAETVPKPHSDESKGTPRADPGDTDFDSSRLFVRNLPYTVTEEELHAFLETREVGPLEEVSLLSFAFLPLTRTL